MDSQNDEKRKSSITESDHSVFETPRNSVPDDLQPTIKELSDEEYEAAFNIADPEIDDTPSHANDDDVGQNEEKTETKKDRFKRFDFDEDEDKTRDPTRSYTGSFNTTTPDSNKAHISESIDKSVKSAVHESSMASTTCCFICLLIVIAIVLIAAGVGLNYGFMPPSRKHLKDPEFPECNVPMFEDKVRRKITIDLDKSWTEIREMQKMETEGLEMNINGTVIKQIRQQIDDPKTQMILLYGSIEKHKGTLQVFGQLEASIAEEVKVWLFDNEQLMKYDGNTHERCACLFERADEWQKANPDIQLLVVLDHLSEYYQNEKTPSDRGILWNELKSLVSWKKDKRWKLFVVESDPTVMSVGKNADYAKKIFAGKHVKIAKAVCMPFDGAILFDQAMTQLMNENVLSIDGGLNSTKWDKLITNMRYFNLYDAYTVYYLNLRNKAKEKWQVSGLPVVFKFDYLSKIIADHNTVFKENSIERMAEFAKSVGDNDCFDDAKIIKVLREDGMEKGVDDEDFKEDIVSRRRRATPISHSTMIIISVILVLMIIVLLCVWAYETKFENRVADIE